MMDWINILYRLYLYSQKRCRFYKYSSIQGWMDVYVWQVHICLLSMLRDWGICVWIDMKLFTLTIIAVQHVWRILKQIPNGKHWEYSTRSMERRVNMKLNHFINIMNQVLLGFEDVEWKINIVDSIMGSGKTSWAIQKMNEDKNNKYVFITPFLDEVKRIEELTQTENSKNRLTLVKVSKIIYMDY